MSIRMKWRNKLIWSKIDEVMVEIAKELRNSKGSEVFYSNWIELSEYSKGVILKKIKRCIVRVLHDKRFITAIAKDVIKKDGVIKIDTEVSQYLIKEMYRGDVSRFLKEMKEVIEREVRDYEERERESR